MELDQLKTTWKSSFDSPEDGSRSVPLGRTNAGRLTRIPIFELIVGALTALVCGNFLFDNLAASRQLPLYAIPAIAIQALAIVTIALSVRQIVAISALDFAGPIVEAQRKLAEFKRLRVRASQFVMLVALPVWVIFPLVAGQLLWGFEFVGKVDTAWMIANFAFGLLVSAGIVVAARRYGEQSPFFQKVNDLLAGTEIVEAENAIAQIEQFERP